MIIITYRLIIDLRQLISIKMSQECFDYMVYQPLFPPMKKYFSITAQCTRLPATAAIESIINKINI
jgi:hypothetical protein